MAIWQFGFYLVPSTAVIIDGAVAARMERDFLSTQLKFCGPIVGALAARVSNMFPERQSWAPDLRVWGDVDANDHAVSSRREEFEFNTYKADLHARSRVRLCFRFEKRRHHTPL